MKCNPAPLKRMVDWVGRKARTLAHAVAIAYERGILPAHDARTLVELDRKATPLPGGER